MDIPVLFLVFNRPGLTRTVLEAIRQAQPRTVYIASDGPVKNATEDREKVEAVRKLILDGLRGFDVRTLFSEENLGCKTAVSSAISWFFEHEEMGIILEDDCLPDPSFFPYCEELLKRYRDDRRVMHIGGCNFQEGIERGTASYYFSRYNHIWGWASWRRAWHFYDVKMKGFPDFRRRGMLRKVFDNTRAMRYWLRILHSVYAGKVNTWDYQWTYAIWAENGLSIVPNVNLVSNLGFGKASTHTSNPRDRHSGMESSRISLPLSHPKDVAVDREADDFIFRNSYCTPFFRKVFFKCEDLAAACSRVFSRRCSHEL